MPPAIELILCDVGNVLGTNGWDHAERKAAAQNFGLDYASFEVRHEEAVDTWESGRMTLDEYLDFVVFNEPRSFTRQEFKDFMFAQSRPYPDAIELMRQVAATGRYVMMAMNNESAELQAYRVALFGLEPLFIAFLTSCYIGARKPDPLFYDRALAIAHVDPARTVFIDDREVNIAPVAARGINTIQAKGAQSIRDGLAALGVTIPAS